MQQRNFSQYFWFNKLLMQSCGVMPLSTRNPILKFMPVYLSLVATGFLNLPAIYSLSFHWSRIGAEETANIISEHIELFVGAVKVIALLPKRQKISKLVKSCSNMWMSVKNDDDYQEISVFAEQALFLTYGFYLNVFFALVSIAVTPMVSMLVSDNNQSALETKQLPYLIGFTPDSYFNIIYGLQISAGFISLLPIPAIDTAVAFFCLHGCTHARLCQIRFRQLADADDLEQSKAGFDESIVKCIGYHQRLLQFSRDIEDVFSNVILIQTVLSILVICGYSFNLLILDADEYFKYSTHLIGAMIQWWMFCWPPHVLQLETMGVAHAAYDLPWYTWSRKKRRLVEIIIARSQIPATLTAGKFTVISVQTFSSICSTALSCFTVLRRVI